MGHASLTVGKADAVKEARPTVLHEALQAPGDVTLALLESVTGHLRRRPDRAAERRLRAMFAELDEELAAVLGDRRPEWATRR
jgi:hypothetical protein